MQTRVIPGTSRILAAGHVRVNRGQAALPAEESCEGRSRVETREQGGVIREIIVTCACGKKTVVACEY